MSDDEAIFGQWCIAELFGHRRAAGYVVQAQFPAGWVRLEIPEVNGHPAVTQLYNPSALYGLHPVSEAIARQAAASFRPQPVQRWELPAAHEDDKPREEVFRDDDEDHDYGDDEP